MEVSLVPKEYVNECWNRVEEYLARAAEYTYGRFTVDDIKDCVTEYDDQYHLWVAFEEDKIYGAVVTEFVHYPRCKTLSMQFCGGDELHRWKDPMLALLRRWAKDTGCEKIEAYARPGWSKIFKNDGYKASFITFDLPVE